MNKIKAKLNISEEELIEIMTSEFYDLYIGNECVRVDKEKAIELMQTVTIKAIAGSSNAHEKIMLAYDPNDENGISAVLKHELYMSLNNISYDIFDEGCSSSCAVEDELDRLAEFFCNYPGVLLQEPVGTFLRIIELAGDAYDDCNVTVAHRYYGLAHKLYEEFYR